MSALDARLAPVLSEFRSLKNSEAARARIEAKGSRASAAAAQSATTPGAAAAGASQGNAPDLDTIPDPATRAWVAQLQRENEARAQREAEAAEQAKRDKAANTLRTLIERDKPARPAKLFALLNPYLKVGTDGKVYHDDGEQMRPVEDVFREQLADDVFNPKSVAAGTGAASGVAPRIAATGASARYAQIADPEERLARIYADGAAG